MNDVPWSLYLELGFELRAVRLQEPRLCPAKPISFLKCAQDPPRFHQASWQGKDV